MVGKLIYKYFHKPLGSVKDSGGIFGYLLVKLGQASMKKASLKLSIKDFGTLNGNTTICGVAGKNNWYQMIFCLHSFFKHSKVNFPVVIIDDGSIDENLKLKIESAIPYCNVILQKDSNETILVFFSDFRFININEVKSKFNVFENYLKLEFV